MKVDWEVAVGIACILFFAWVMWRGGSSNPVGTGQLQRQLNTIGSKVGSLEAAVIACASKGELEKMSAEMKEMEKRVASSGEVFAVQEQIKTVNARMTGIEKLVERTDAGVARIEGYFLEKGIRGQ